MLEPPCRGSSNKYLQVCIEALQTLGFLIKVGFKGVYISWTCFPGVVCLEEGVGTIEGDHKGFI